MVHTVRTRPSEKQRAIDGRKAEIRYFENLKHFDYATETLVTSKVEDDKVHWRHQYTKWREQRLAAEAKAHRENNQPGDEGWMCGMMYTPWQRKLFEQSTGLRVVGKYNYPAFKRWMKKNFPENVFTMGMMEPDPHVSIPKNLVIR